MILLGEDLLWFQKEQTETNTWTNSSSAAARRPCLHIERRVPSLWLLTWKVAGSFRIRRCRTRGVAEQDRERSALRRASRNSKSVKRSSAERNKARRRYDVTRVETRRFFSQRYLRVKVQPLTGHVLVETITIWNQARERLKHLAKVTVVPASY